jgi:hypothetical protein
MMGKCQSKRLGTMISFNQLCSSVDGSLRKLLVSFVQRRRKRGLEDCFDANMLRSQGQPNSILAGTSPGAGMAVHETKGVVVTHTLFVTIHPSLSPPIDTKLYLPAWRLLFFW